MEASLIGDIEVTYSIKSGEVRAGKIESQGDNVMAALFLQYNRFGSEVFYRILNYFNRVDQTIPVGSSDMMGWLPDVASHSFIQEWRFYTIREMIEELAYHARKGGLDTSQIFSHRMVCDEGLRDRD